MNKAIVSQLKLCKELLPHIYQSKNGISLTWEIGSYTGTFNRDVDLEFEHIEMNLYAIEKSISDGSLLSGELKKTLNLYEQKKFEQAFDYNLKDNILPSKDLLIIKENYIKLCEHYGILIKLISDYLK